VTTVQPRLPLPGVDDFHLDDRTREVGRRGVAEARAILDAIDRRTVSGRTARHSHGAGRW